RTGVPRLAGTTPAAARRTTQADAEGASPVAIHSAGGRPMNELAIRFGWLTGQVTLLSLVAAGLCALLARRHPGAGAGVALAGLGGLVVLTLLAATPMPVWWSWT